MMIKIRTALLLTLAAIGMGSCDVTQQLAKDLGNIPTISTSTPLTQTEVSNGLKRALSVGTEQAAATLSQPNAVLKSPIYHIALPPQLSVITENKNNPLLQAVGISNLIDQAETSMNLAAEKSMNLAKPIFLNAIQQMTIQDAFALLNGGDTAATHFLRKSTYNALFEAFKPEVIKTIEQPILSGVSTRTAYNQLVTKYNNVAAYAPGLNKVDANLENYVTHKALFALFEEVKKEEFNIRENPQARIDDLLKRVFGSL
jgi:hypothetical protein